MSTDKDKLDDLFRKGLEDPVDHVSYREPDWDSLEQMLDKHKKRRGIIYWLPVLSSVAALLLVFLGWWLFTQKAPQNHQPQNVVVNHPKEKVPVISNGPKRQPDHRDATPNSTEYAGNHHQINSAAYAKNNNHPARSDGNKTSFALSANNAGGDVDGSNPKELTGRQFTEALTAVNYLPAMESASITADPVNSVSIPMNAMSKATASAAKENKGKIKPKNAYRPQYALSVFGAPDVNGVGTFQQSKLGTNIGMAFSMGVSRKFTLTTGVMYADKTYLTDFANYHTAYKFPTNPVNVAADCRMLDIPLNINFQVYNKHQNSISFGTGLSSYIMLDQKYKFNYSDPYTVGPSKFDVSGNDKYFFSIVNLTATYQRQLNSKVGINIQPYLKLPLENIGYSQVRLQTTGVAVGLTWNLNSLSKQ